MPREERIMQNPADGLFDQVMDVLNNDYLKPGALNSKYIREEMVKCFQGLVQKNRYAVVDNQSEQLLTYICLILAAYQVLLTIIKNQNQVIDILKDIIHSQFKKNIKAYLLSRFGITQEDPENAFEMVCRNFIKRGELMVGKAFKYEQDVLDINRCFINVRKCFFHETFSKNNAPILTSLSCGIDMLWAEELSKPQYGIKFKRPCTIAEGYDVCQFQFYKN